jgi:hypothetical protein
VHTRRSTLAPPQPAVKKAPLEINGCLTYCNSSVKLVAVAAASFVIGCRQEAGSGTMCHEHHFVHTILALRHSRSSVHLLRGRRRFDDGTCMSVAKSIQHPCLGSLLSFPFFKPPWAGGGYKIWQAASWAIDWRAFHFNTLKKYTPGNRRR